MESLFRYLIIASLSVSLIYTFYLIFYKKENNFKLARAYLLFGLLFSLVLPFNKYQIDLPLFTNPVEKITETREIVPPNNKTTHLPQKHSIENQQKLNTENQASSTSIEIIDILISIYLLISLLLLGRILYSALQIGWYYMVSEKKKYQGFTIIYLEKKSSPFSFFRSIFIPKSRADKKTKQIIEHEKIHAKQFHTIDLLITELLVAAMWFNPFIWLYKRELQQVHEFLADEGVLNTGVDQLEYQSLLINQLAEGKLVAVSSNFSYSLIKKRINMMSQSKKMKSTRSKGFMIIPVLVFLIIGVSLFNQPAKASSEKTGNKMLKNVNLLPASTPVATGTVNSTAPAKQPEIEKKKKDLKNKVAEKTKIAAKKQLSPQDTVPENNTELVAAVSATKMNVLYIGVDNPITIGVTGANMKDVKASIDNGSITGENGNYIVRARGPQGMKATITVKANDKIVAEKKFRVKRVPDPIAMIGTTRGGSYSKDVLLKAKGVDVVMINFDFDLKFEIVSFNVSAQVHGGFVEDAKQHKGGNFTKEQIRIISNLEPGKKIYIEDIKARGPDGTIRDLGSLTYKIVE